MEADAAVVALFRAFRGNASLDELPRWLDALAAIGLTIDALKRLDSEGALRRVQERLTSYLDNDEKASRQQDLFGVNAFNPDGQLARVRAQRERTPGSSR